MNAPAVDRPAAGAPAAPGRAGPFIGTGALVRLILRRDRILLPVWLLLTWGTVVGRADSMAATYPTAEEREARFDEVMVGVPMFKLFQGPAYGDDVNALTAQEAFAGATLIAALGAALLLVRHTRGEERTGRRELLGSAAIGRHAPLTAALAVVLGAGVLLAVLCAAALIGYGMPAAGSLALGLVCGGAVWVCAAVAAVAAQLTENPGLAGVGAYSLFFALHFVRGASDLGGEGMHWLGWLTPNGWLQRARPFADERWWLFLPVIALVAALLWAAYRLSSRRDLGSGLLPARAGPAAAPASLRGPFGLAWRLNRSAALVWLFAALAVCLPTGYGGAGAMEQYAGGERMRVWADAMGAGRPGDAFFAYIAFAMGFPIAIYAIMTVLRLGAEEGGGTAETLLATPVGRLRWAAGHLVFALGVSALLQVAIGVGFGLGAGLHSGELGADLARMLTVTTALVPAVWVMAGIAMAAFGLVGRRAPAVAWGALVVAVTVEFGQHLGWPEWLFRVFSPFAHVLPFFGPPSPITLTALTLVAAALCAVGLFGLRHRDVGAR